MLTCKKRYKVIIAGCAVLLTIAAIRRQQRQNQKQHNDKNSEYKTLKDGTLVKLRLATLQDKQMVIENLSDIGIIKAGSKKAGDFIGRNWEGYMTSQDKDEKIIICCVVVDSNRIIGMTGVGWVSSTESWIFGSRTDPTFKRQGVLSILFKEATRRVLERHGPDAVGRMNVTMSNTPMLTWCKKKGIKQQFPITRYHWKSAETNKEKLTHLAYVFPVSYSCASVEEYKEIWHFIESCTTPLITKSPGFQYQKITPEVIKKRCLISDVWTLRQDGNMIGVTILSHTFIIRELNIQIFGFSSAKTQQHKELLLSKGCEQAAIDGFDQTSISYSPDWSKACDNLLTRSTDGFMYLHEWSYADLRK